MWTKGTQRNGLISSKGTTRQLNNGIVFSQGKRQQKTSFKKPYNNALCIIQLWYTFIFLYYMEYVFMVILPPQRTPSFLRI